MPAHKKRWIFQCQGRGAFVENEVVRMKVIFAFQDLVELCQRTHEEMRCGAARAKNAYLVIRNWFFGWHIVEYEQNGSDRAEYGAATLQNLSAALKASIGRGFSVESLEQMRRFYIDYKDFLPHTTISETVSRISSLNNSEAISWKFAFPTKALSVLSKESSAELFEQIKLRWSHYVSLMAIDNLDERRFYEIEAAVNGWKVLDLERHIANSLFERMSLSRNKEELQPTFMGKASGRKSYRSHQKLLGTGISWHRG